MYELTLSADYLKHWTVEDAVRELVQNAVDFSEEGTLDYSIFGEEVGDTTLLINSTGVSLHPSVLLLGSGDKSEDDTKLGGFGEGMKVAMLILAREGIRVTMHNGDKIWTPLFKHNEQFGTDMLCISEEENIGKSIGVRYTIQGLTQTELQNIKTRTLQMQDYEGIQTSYGEVLEGHEGKVFVGGLYVCTTNTRYGYNFTKGSLPLNRDRQTVPDWDLKRTTDKMLAEALPPEDYVALVSEQVNDVDHAKHWAPKESISAVANKAFVEEHGVRPLAESELQASLLRKQGYKDPFIMTNSGLYNIITKSEDYDKGEQSVVISKEDKLHKLLCEHGFILEALELFEDEIYDQYADFVKQVKGVFNE